MGIKPLGAVRRKARIWSRRGVNVPVGRLGAANARFKIAGAELQKAWLSVPGRGMFPAALKLARKKLEVAKAVHSSALDEVLNSSRMKKEIKSEALKRAGKTGTEKERTVARRKNILRGALNPGAVMRLRRMKRARLERIPLGVDRVSVGQRRERLENARASVLDAKEDFGYASKHELKLRKLFASEKRVEAKLELQERLENAINSRTNAEIRLRDAEFNVVGAERALKRALREMDEVSRSGSKK
ncbi:MAG: hypothetical protein WC308_01515 [archaeon]|jgi:hypothetical protein